MGLQVWTLRLHCIPLSPGLHLGPLTHQLHQGSLLMTCHPSCCTEIPCPTVSTWVHHAPGSSAFWPAAVSSPPTPLAPSSSTLAPGPTQSFQLQTGTITLVLQFYCVALVSTTLTLPRSSLLPAPPQLAPLGTLPLVIIPQALSGFLHQLFIRPFPYGL